MLHLMGNWRASATDEQRQRFKESVSKWKKKMWENLSEEEKIKRIEQLKINVEKWRKNQTDEKKKKFREKMSKVMKERWKNKEYRELKSKQVSEQMRAQRGSYTEEEKEFRIQDIKNKAKEYRESLTEEGRREYIDKMYQWRVAAAEEREKRWEIKRPCQYPQCILWAKADSWENLKWENIFIDKWYSFLKEFPLWNYMYDFKINNTLIEINPYAWHNSTWVPNYPWAKIKDKYYHYNKTKYAIDGWYNIINIRDWIDKNTVLSLLNKTTHIKDAPTLHRYNPKSKEHLIDEWYDTEDMLSKGFIEIRDWGEFY